ncbi:MULTISPECIES: LxmA leader domain family RiPP [unclassified Streptomyces]|uniref:LxmA leader domain family RiPP n=1 Tax=unclassified Streptomyces TaxID=2593676 RepID=UPI002E0D2B9D|nr:MULTISPECIES: LxmA leader domain family RiPP [unclassified Streptomyces]WSR29088.1 LxmA leader domain family RiPP [Streptomyces sp. NBC_01205]
MNATQLIAGYTAYTTAEEFGATAQGDAPATTPSILSFIDISSAACGAAVSAVSAASVGATAHVGC